MSVGSIIIRNDPVKEPERFLLNLVPQGKRGYSEARFSSYNPSDRAEGGYWGLSFNIHARELILKELFECGLGRLIEVWGYGLEPDFEGWIDDIVFTLPPDRVGISLRRIANKVFIRADTDGDETAERSTPIENSDSQDTYGVFDKVLSGGVLSGSSVADQTVQQYVDLRALPMPEAVFGGASGREASIEIFARGYIHTLERRIYNQTIETGTQSLSSEVGTIIGERLKVLKPRSWEQTFDEEIADFDVVSPSWDKEVDAVGDFDAEVDADGDLNDHADAAHDGAVGLEITFDDANAAYGRLDLAAVNQSSIVVKLYFDPNTFGLEVGKVADICYGRDGAAANNLILRIQNTGGVYYLLVYVANDSAGNDLIQNLALTDGWNEILVYCKVSTGAGNNDGITRVFVDGVQTSSKTDSDNDTLDFDDAISGMLWTNSTTFSGSFYLDTIKIDPVGAPFVDKLAAKTGTYGLAVPIMDTTARYGQLTDPTSEAKIQFELSFSTKGMTMASGDVFRIANDTSDNVFLDLMYDGSDYLIRAGLKDDDGAYHYTGTIPYTSWELVRIAWWASSGSDEGGLFLYQSDRKVGSVTDIDNDTKTVEEVVCGAISGIDSGTYGILYFDDVRWVDGDSTITLESGIGEFITNTDRDANTTAVNREHDIDRRGLDILLDLPRLGDSNSNRWLLLVEGRDCTGVVGRIGRLKQASPVEPPA